MIKDWILISKGKTILWCLFELYKFDDDDVDADVERDMEDDFVWWEWEDYSEIYYVAIDFFVIYEF